MLPILYTDTDAVRSVLGITEEDIKDDDLVARDLLRELRIDLNTWLPTHAAIYAYGDLTTPTDTQVTQYDLLVTYAKYYCALLVARSTLALAAAQQVGDGKNTMARFTPFSLQQLQEQLAGKVMEMKNALATLFSAEATTVVSLAQFTGVGQAIDPVVGATPVSPPTPSFIGG